MALQMDYVASDGGDHPDSYWIVSQTLFDHINKIGTIVFYGYHDVNFALAKKTTIASLTYQIDQATYAAFFAPELGLNDVNQAYVYAMQVPKPMNMGELAALSLQNEIAIANGQPITTIQSFFEQAKIVV